MSKKRKRRIATVKKEPSSEHALDSVGIAILNELREDGRRSYRLIAKNVGLSEAAVRQRVNQMVESKAVKIVAMFDPSNVGLGESAWIGLTVDGNLQAIADEIKKLPQANYMFLSVGHFDLIVYIYYKDSREHLDAMTTIRNIKGVKTMDFGLVIQTWDSLFLPDQE